jgi:hypothetical protein
LRVGGRGVEGIEGARLRLTRSAVAFAMMCPTLLLRPLEESRAFGEDILFIGWVRVIFFVVLDHVYRIWLLGLWHSPGSGSAISALLLPNHAVLYLGPIYTSPPP